MSSRATYAVEALRSPSEGLPWPDDVHEKPPQGNLVLRSTYPASRSPMGTTYRNGHTALRYSEDRLLDGLPAAHAATS